MTSRFALSIAPILLLVASNQAHAAVKKADHPDGRTMASATRHTKARIASTRHHVKLRHLAMHHVKVRGRHVGYTPTFDGVPETDGWNPALADISPPHAPIGASVRHVSFTQGSAQLLATGRVQTGIASYYGHRHNGRLTASGDVFHEHAMTAAHATLPFGTKVRVQDPENGRFVIVTITDRLHEPHRIIDLSEGAAERLGIIRQGLAMVTLTPLN
jgi:rare lipoprotein A